MWHVVTYYSFSKSFEHVFWNYSSISQNSKHKPFCQNYTNSFQNCFFHQTVNTAIKWIPLREHQLNTGVINSKHCHQNTMYICFGFIRPCYIFQCIQLFRNSLFRNSFLKVQLGCTYSIKTVAKLYYNTVDISYKYCIGTIVSEYTMHICLSNELQWAKFTIPASQSQTVHL